MIVETFANFIRILIACQRFLGQMPRTLMLKKYIPALGTKVDMQRRQHIRTDNEIRRALVESARKLIFIHGIGINGAQVEARLKEQSLTPTRVIIYFNFSLHNRLKLF